MSIARKVGESESITRGSRALRFFINRYEAIRLFCGYLNDDPSREKILYFYANGGNGKSLLLRFLRIYCCKRFGPDNWTYIKSLNDEEFKAHVIHAEEDVLVPHAFLDFGMQPHGDERPQEAFSALLMLRRDLAKYGIHFPPFDFASILYLKKTGHLTDQRLQDLFPAEEMDLIVAVANVVSGLPGLSLGKAVLSVFDKYMHGKFRLYVKRRGLDASIVSRLEGMDAESELAEELPILFAEDLNTAVTLQELKRVVLFFDSHEAFWGSQRDLSDDLFFQRDEWFRKLLSSLELAWGIVTVIAGRERPRWNEAAEARIPCDSSDSNDCIDAYLVGNLPDREALRYLSAVSISDPSMQNRLLSCARVTTNEIHPLYLGLCADVVLAAANRGKALFLDDLPSSDDFLRAENTLIQRLFRYVDDEIAFAVRSLSACRAFDQNIYFYLGDSLEFAVSRPKFLSLIRFSFVSSIEGYTYNKYRIHDLIRRLMMEKGDEVLHEAHASLERYYRRQVETGNKNAIIEAIYHTNRLDWERGIREWIDAFCVALRSCAYDMCRSLLDVHTELVINSAYWRGRSLFAIADYFDCLARRTEARQAFDEARIDFEVASQATPDDVDVYNRQGNAIRRLAVALGYLSQHKAAQENYIKAVVTFDEALKRDPDNVYALTNKANALGGLAGLQAQLSMYDEAAKNYEKAAIAFDAALGRASGGEIDGELIHSHKGYMLLGFGDMQANLATYYEAAKSYTSAVVAFDATLSRVPDSVFAHGHKGLALTGLGNMQVRLGLRDSAQESYRRAISALDSSLEYAPEAVYVRNYKGNALRCLGDLQVAQSAFDVANSTYKQAISAADETLARAPLDASAYIYKGRALLSIADLQDGLERWQEVIDSCILAISSFDMALRYAPDHITALNNKGMAYYRLARARVRMSQRDAAMSCFRSAIETYSRSLNIAAHDTTIYAALAQAHEGLAALS